MRTLPRINGPIFDTGENFTPENFSAAWNAAMAEIEMGGASGAAGLDPLITGYGRIAGADYFDADATAPRSPSSPALAIEIPNATWLVQGHLIALDEPSGALTLVAIPPNMAGRYGYVSALEIEDSGGEFTLEITPENWFDTLQPDLSRQGLACIGKVTSDTDTVTAIDGTFADVIVPLGVIRRFLKNLSLGNTSGGEGNALVYGSSIPITPTDPTSIKAYIDSQIADAVAAMRVLIQNGVGDAWPDDTTILAELLAGVVAGLLEVNPHAIERLQMAIVVKQSGHGQSDTPDFTPDSDDPALLPYDSETGLFGPLGS